MATYLDAQIDKINRSWIIGAVGAAATATATAAAVAGKCNVLRTVIVTNSAVTSASATLTLTFTGSTITPVVIEIPTGSTSPFTFNFGTDGIMNPIVNSTITAVLTTTGVTASVVIAGYFTDAPL